MKTPLKVLLIEHSENDALLILSELRKSNFEPIYQRIETENELNTALEKQEWDIVLSAYTLPKFKGLDALNIVKTKDPNTPFIIVSGTIEEEIGIETVKAGANDYLLKGNLKRLTQAINKSLEEGKIKREQHQEKERMHVHAKITEILSQANEPLEAVQKIVDNICQIFQMEMGIFWNKDPDETLHNTYLWCSPDPEINAFKKMSQEITFGLGIDIPGRVWESKQSICIREVVNDKNFPRARVAALANFHSAFAFPIMHSGQAHGVIEFFTQKRREFGGATLDLLSATGMQIGAFYVRKNLEKELKNQQKQYQRIVATANEGIWEMDAENKITFINRKMIDILGCREGEIIGATPSAFLNPESQTHFTSALFKLKDGQPHEWDLKLYRKDGTQIWTHVSATPNMSEAGEYQGAIALFTDISERKEFEAALHLGQEQYRRMLEHSPYGILVCTNGSITYTNQALVKLLGAGNPAFVIGKTIFDFIHTDDWPQVREREKRFLVEQKMSEPLKQKVIRMDGKSIEVEVLAAPIIYQNKPGTQILLTDLSLQKSAEAKLTFLEYNDPLTGLANRAFLEMNLSKSILSGKIHKQMIALMIINIVGFKYINSSLSYSIGDLLLKEVAKRLQTLSNAQLVARLEGDQFALLYFDLEHPDMAVGLAEKILDIFHSPVILNNNEQKVSLCIGISLFPNDAENSKALITKAEIAVTRAKEAGKNKFQFSSEEMSSQVNRRVSLEKSLHRALENDEFVLHYQPIVNLNTGKIDGVESLIRWETPDQGIISPAEFIPLAEETGLIVPIGEWVFEKSCQVIAAWQGFKNKPTYMSINLSSRQLMDKDLIASFERILQRSGTDPTSLQLEITENMIMKNIDQSISFVKKFKELGTKIAIDDFGTGYSSLGYIKYFNIDTLKIDKTFISGALTNANDKTIVSAIIALGHALDVKLIAEGVETEEQLNFLKEERCELIQGYYFSKPLPVEDMEALFKDEAPFKTHKVELKEVETEKPTKRAAKKPDKKQETGG